MQCPAATTDPMRKVEIGTRGEWRTRGEEAEDSSLARDVTADSVIKCMIATIPTSIMHAKEAREQKM